MKTFKINLQTTLFLTELSVLGAYNENKQMLVYNKPLCQGDTLEKMIAQIKAEGKEIRSTFQTDSFGVNFYDPASGGTGEFHTVKGKLQEGADPIEYNDTIKKELFQAFLEILKEVDPRAYEEEGKDGFVDLYNYWTERGSRRLAEKMRSLI